MNDKEGRTKIVESTAVRYKITDKGLRYFHLLEERESETDEGKKFRAGMTEYDWQLQQLLVLTEDIPMSREDYLKCLETSRKEGKPQIHIDMMDGIDSLIGRALGEQLIEFEISGVSLYWFDVLFKKLSLRDQKQFLEDHRPLGERVLMTYFNGSTETDRVFESVEGFRYFIVRVVTGKYESGAYVPKDLIAKAQALYLERTNSLIESCPVRHYHDFFEAHIRGKDLKDYPTRTLLCIINLCSEVAHEELTKWCEAVPSLRKLYPKGCDDSKYGDASTRELIERVWSAEDPRRSFDKSKYSNLIVRNVSVNGNPFYNEHCFTEYMV